MISTFIQFQIVELAIETIVSRLSRNFMVVGRNMRNAKIGDIFQQMTYTDTDTVQHRIYTLHVCQVIGITDVEITVRALDAHIDFPTEKYATMYYNLVEGFVCMRLHEKTIVVVSSEDYTITFERIISCE